ncbi:MAG: VCBS repeat-containing protein [Balneolales bacterium]
MRKQMSQLSLYGGSRVLILVFVIVLTSGQANAQSEVEQWNHPQFDHISTVYGDLEVPNPGNQQTATLVTDFDNSGINDFIISERTEAPAVVWYRRNGESWDRYIIEDEALEIEAGATAHDITGNGYQDLVLAGDYRSNEIWWWENPGPPYEPDTPWVRHTLKNSGQNKHHDVIFGDFTVNGNSELAFWNQDGSGLHLAEIPVNPKDHQGEWTRHTIYSYSADGEMEPRGEYPDWRRTHAHEGFAAIDVNGDGVLNIVGGGRWFEHTENYNFTEHIIDASYTFVRVAAGQLVEGGRPEVVAVAGDGLGPLMLYEWEEGIWEGVELIERVRDGHSLEIVDFNKDGYLDIFAAEMQVGDNPKPTTWIMLGDGQGGFTKNELLRGYGLHEGRMADLTGDGNLDILAKPYAWDTPRLDLWINRGKVERDASYLPVDRWERHLIETELPHRAIYVDAADITGNGFKDIVTGGWWYENPGNFSGEWKRHVIGEPLNNMAVVYDFTGNGYPDILGTKGRGAQSNSEFVWARNEGNGSFTIFENIEPAEGDFLQGVTVDRFQSDGLLEVALSWHVADVGVQMLTVPENPATEVWNWRRLSHHSEDEDLSTADITGNGLPDLYLGTSWLENPGNHTDMWKHHLIGEVTKGLADRNRVLDFTGNGRLDAVVGLELGEDMLLFSSPENLLDERGQTVEWERTVFARGIVGGGFSMDAGDMTGNGLPDVVLGEHRGSPANRLIIFENLEYGRVWIPHIVDRGDPEEIDHHDASILVDLDGDEALDIISIGWYNPKLWIFENKAKKHWE